MIKSNRRRFWLLASVSALALMIGAATWVEPANADTASTTGNPAAGPDRGHLNPAATPAALKVDPHVVGHPEDRRPDLSDMANNVTVSLDLEAAPTE